MKALSQHIIGALLLCLGLAAQASPDKPTEARTRTAKLEHYQYLMQVEISGKNGVAALRLPAEVYLQARHADLRDVRLFDAQGNSIPFAFHTPSAPEKHSVQQRPVKVFALHGKLAEAGQTAVDLDIQTDAQGRVANVKLRQPESGKRPAALQALLIDIGLAKGETSPAFDSLEFAAPECAQQYQGEVMLAVSDDLQHWETIAAASLHWLRNEQGEELVQNRIQFSPRGFRYARLSWNSGVPCMFEQIVARSSQNLHPTRQLDSLKLSPQNGLWPQDLRYLAAPALPIEKIDLEFKPGNIVLPLTVGGYRHHKPRQVGKAAETTFDGLATTSFYQITQNGQTRRSQPLELPVTRQAEWVLRLQNPPTEKPHLLVYWHAAQLIFLASGPGPYQLAVGAAADIPSAARSLHEVAPQFSASELERIEQAKLGKLQTNPKFSGTREDDKLAQSKQRRNWILWGVLLAGVVCIGLVVMRLAGQMNSSGATKNE